MSYLSNLKGAIKIKSLAALRPLVEYALGRVYGCRLVDIDCAKRQEAENAPLRELAEFSSERGSGGCYREKSLVESIPLAEVCEENLEFFSEQNWREIFSRRLSGRGLEIGALHRPLVAHDKMCVQYIDRLSIQEMKEHYPELKELALVEPDIISDAETLTGVADNAYDFIVSAHVIEHMLNPIGSIENWLRILKPGGLLYLIVPDKRAIFDKKRPRTSLEHIIADYYQPSEERDFLHYLDYATYVHDRSQLDAYQDAIKLRDEDYSIHFHVFIPTDIVNLLNWVSAYVTPCEIDSGPTMSPGSDEFHLIVRKLEVAEDEQQTSSSNAKNNSLANTLENVHI